MFAKHTEDNQQTNNKNVRFVCLAVTWHDEAKLFYLLCTQLQLHKSSKELTRIKHLDPVLQQG